ncbi:formin-like protein 3 [Toxotes jaculatrix]|uniref:formin-like protein 3 n=1 Tax=Toxotes jaculatrix TaxID=941984 RepID=UPI001B3AB84D|nr:formin-like protein 3 [Toxotes jaculatrix]
MDTAAQPPPPPPPPPPSQNLAPIPRPKPHPQPAAVPFTSLSPESVNDAQAGDDPPPLQGLNAHPSPSSEGQEDNHSDSEEKYHPVQETDPAPQALNSLQMTEQQDGQPTHMDPAGEGQ